MQSATERARTLAILAGGEGRRMGGAPKGNLPARSPGETLLDRTLRVGRDARFERFVLVGREERLLPYARHALERVFDRRGLDGPLAGLAALCEQERAPFVLVACDMPALDAAVLARLAEGSPTHAVLAPRDETSGRWDPMLAWYHPLRARGALDRAIEQGARSFQRAFSLMDCAEFSLNQAERATLEDWDSPGDGVQ